MAKEESNDGLKYLLIIVVVLMAMWWTISDNARVKYIHRLEDQITDYEKTIEEYEDIIEDLRCENESLHDDLNFYYEEAGV